MTEHEQTKVYELAKELGIDSISLLGKLKDLNIKVKNHMSELTDDDLRVARESLRRAGAAARAGAGASLAGTPTTTTKKATVSRTRKKAEPVAAKSEPEIKVVSEPVAKPTKPSTSKSAAAKAAAAAAADKKNSPILRRRVSTEGGSETLTTSIVGGTADPLATQHAYGPEAHANDTPFEAPAPEAPVEAEEPQITETVEAQEYSEAQPSVEPPAAEVLSEAPVVEAAPVAETSATPVAEPGAPNVSLTPAAASAPATTAPPATPPRQRAPIILPPRPVAPRKSILKIVEAPVIPPKPVVKPVAPVSAPVKPIIKKGPGTGPISPTGPDGFRIIRMTKENLDQMVEEEAARKRAGLGREVEIRPEDVRFADYRKKEMVFLPKKKRIPVGKEIRKTKITEAKATKRYVEMEEAISVQDFAAQMSLKAIDVIRKLMSMGQMVSVNSSIDFDTATLVAAEYKFEVRNVAFKEASVLDTEEDAPESLVPRPPVVTIMGHVDHGKTTLLDSIRESNVVAGEAGGITQHIGAYTIVKNGHPITFIDTPGHEAFSVMRARGANVTDIVIIVVSADDGVMPQTREAISHAQAAKVPIIVAINKIDKPGANPERIKQALAELNLLAEDWGGETIFVPVSALQKTNLDKLLDSILVQAEVLELKANPSARASGNVLEARLERGRGPVVSALIRRGTLRVGDHIVAGTIVGRVKAMTGQGGTPVAEATPGIAVEILGFDGVPSAGETFSATLDDEAAQTIAQHRADKIRSQQAADRSKVSLDSLFAKIQAGNVKELSVILKADVFGSVEAIRDSLLKLSTEKVKVKVIHAAPGGITESDVLLATASSAIIIGFNVRPETKARQVAEAEHIDIRCYSIIYELIDDIKQAMTGLLEKKKVEKFLGRAEVRTVFTIPKIGAIAGSSVIDGKVLRGANVRLLRDSRIVFEGKMSSLKRFKDDAKEVAQGFECGIGIENYNDLKPGDIIEAYEIELVTPTLDA